MKQFKSCKLIIACLPNGALVDEDQCEFEQEVTDMSVLPLKVQPIPPIYKASKRQNDENKEVIFLSTENLKLAA